MMPRFQLFAAKVRLTAASLMLLGSLSACVGAARVPLDSLSELNSSETIVVGRIEIVPGLAKGEQKVQGLNSGSFENKVFILADEQNRELKSEPVIADYSGRIEATLGQNFFVRSNNKSFFILGGMMYLEVGGKTMSRVYFPGGLKASIKPGDKAIYIGTVQYHRNEFFDISKVTIADDYERANTEFKKKFGTKYTLRKALLTPAN